MALTIAKEKVVTWPVAVNVPVDGGDVTIERFQATFAILDSKVVDALTEEVRSNIDRRAAGETGLVTSVDEFVLRKAIRSLEDLQDEDKKPLSYTEDRRDQLLAIPYVRNALWEAYAAACQGRKAKN